MLKFDLDVENAIGLPEIVAKLGGSATVSKTYRGGGYGPCLDIEAPDEPTAFAIVDALYGPEDDSRDSNRFFVYGDEGDE